MKNGLQILGGFAFCALILYLLYKFLENERKIRAAQHVQPVQIVVLLTNVQPEQTEDIYPKLVERKHWFDINAPAFSKDMAEIISLYQRPELHDVAVLKLGMFLETILKYRYIKNVAFKQWRKEKYSETGTAKFERYLEYARHINELNEEEYNFISGIKSMRNKKAHKRSIEFSENLRCSAFYLFLHISDKYQKQNLISV